MRWLPLAVFCLAPIALAAPLSLEEALALAGERDAGVITAQAELAAAERDLARTTADPLALRLTRVQAEHALENARTALESARLTSRLSTTGAYLAALEADEALAIAEQAVAIAAIALEATEIRFNAGAATPLDVERARNDYEAARRDRDDAQQTRALSYSELASLVGLSPEALTLEPVTVMPEIPDLDDLLARLEENRQWRLARQAVELAELRLAAVDNAFSARAEIEAARDALASAEVRLRETRRSLALGLQQSYNAVIAAQGRLTSAAANAATARETLRAQTLRYEAGSISRLEHERAKLDAARAEAQLNSARYALLRALLQLRRTLLGGP
jgi:outer membrane protein TolC